MNKNCTIVGASVKGKYHIDNNIQRQDNFYYKQNKSENYGIAIIADGAGSYSNSHIGSSFVVKNAYKNFKKLIQINNWTRRDLLPSEQLWKEQANLVLKKIADNLRIFAKKKDLQYKSLSTTIIVLIYAKDFLMVSHVGDGRAGYSNETNEWKSIITPYSGNEVGSTIFITSEIWNRSELYIESRIIKDDIMSFHLLTDGMENYTYEIYQRKKNGKYYDPNKPFPNFFIPLIRKLRALKKANTTKKSLKQKWKYFLKNSYIFKNERDDKTMIIGVYD